MDIQVLSDLHNELYRKKGLPIPGLNVLSSTDLIVLAGDIDVGLNGLDWAIKESERVQRPIVYVPGNHEFYGHAYFDTLKKMQIVSEGTGVTVLSDDDTVINGVQIIGTTLWTGFSHIKKDALKAAMAAVEKKQQDYRQITFDSKGRYQALTAKDSRELHWQSLDYLENILEQPFDGRRIVVSHHAPSLTSLSALYQQPGTAAAYASDLDDFIGSYEIDLWCHGHIHSKQDYQIGNTRIYANPRGYLNELAHYRDEIIRLERTPSPATKAYF